MLRPDVIDRFCDPPARRGQRDIRIAPRRKIDHEARRKAQHGIAVGRQERADTDGGGGQHSHDDLLLFNGLAKLYDSNAPALDLCEVDEESAEHEADAQTQVDALVVRRRGARPDWRFPLASVRIFWDPQGLELNALGDNHFVSLTDGDTPNVQMAIRMLSIDTAETKYPNGQSPARMDDELAWIIHERG